MGKPLRGSLTIISILALLGGIVKIYGGLTSGSRSLMIDAFTCFANLVALALSIHYYTVSFKPPDKDHHYGHGRFMYLGILGTMVTYSFVAGISSTLLLYSWDYRVEVSGVYTAIAGFLIYSLVVYLSFRLGEALKVYGFFTISELFESMVTIVATLGGSLYSFVIDYIGGVVLTIYIFFEIYKSFRENLVLITDLSPSPEIVGEVIDHFKRSGLIVEKYRFRVVYGERIHGDIMIRPSNCNNLYKTIESISRVVREVKTKYPFIDLVVGLDYDYCVSVEEGR